MVTGGFIGPSSPGGRMARQAREADSFARVQDCGARGLSQVVSLIENALW